MNNTQLDDISRNASLFTRLGFFEKKEKKARKFFNYLEQNREVFYKQMLDENASSLTGTFKSVSFIAKKKNKTDSLAYFIDLNHIAGSGSIAIVRDYYNLQKRKRLAFKEIVSQDEHHAAMGKREFEILTHLKGVSRYIIKAKFWLDPTNPGMPNPMLVLERCQGDLTKLFEEQLSEPQKIDIMKQILKGMADLHKAGYVHRDIKPENIFYTKDAKGNITIKFADLGLACEKEWKEAYKLVGTPVYYSPEFCGHLCDKEKVPTVDYTKYDMWDVGLTLYRLIKGQDTALVKLGLTLAKTLSYEKWVRTVAQITGISGLDPTNPSQALIAKMLKCNPDERISAEAALLEIPE